MIDAAQTAAEMRQRARIHARIHAAHNFFIRVGESFEHSRGHSRRHVANRRRHFAVRLDERTSARVLYSFRCEFRRLAGLSAGRGKHTHTRGDYQREIESQVFFLGGEQRDRLLLRADERRIVPGVIV